MVVLKWIKQLYQYFADYLRPRLKRPQYILFVASLVGLVSGLGAVLLKELVHYVHIVLEEIPFKLAYLVFPAGGLVIMVWMTRRFFNGGFERGVGMVLKAIARRSSFIPLSHTYMHVVTSAVTVGTGGSAGLEAPIVATGSAIGSNLARVNSLNYRERSLLIACGAAAGIAAVFNAPIAGIIFAIEVLMVETVVSYFIPLIISAVIGALCSKIILEETILFNFILKQNFDYHFVPQYVMLGVLSGYVAVYYAHTFKSIEHKLMHWNIDPIRRAIAGGLMLMVLFVLFPPLFGEGYQSVKLVANGDILSITDRAPVFAGVTNNWAILLFTISIFMLKPLAAAITIGSGGNGGNFAPSLFSGAFLGFSFSRLLNITGWFTMPEGNFSLAGMAGMLSGVMYCPLTAIFLIAEITNGYELFIPLMIVSSISYFIVKHYQPYSMETRELAKEGQIFTHKREQNILSTISLRDMIMDNYSTIGIDKNLMDLIELIKDSDNNIYVVKDKEDCFAGIIELNDVKKLILKRDKLHETSIHQIVKQPKDVIYFFDSMNRVMQKFDQTNTWYLPVLTDDNRFAGFISKSRVFNKYREILSAQSDLYEDN